MAQSGSHVLVMLFLVNVAIWCLIHESEYLGASMLGVAYLFDFKCKSNILAIENATDKDSKEICKSTQSHGL